jgi:hypothetical protein
MIYRMNEHPADDARNMPRWSSGWLFLLLAASAWFVVRMGAVSFPGDRIGAHLGPAAVLDVCGPGTDCRQYVSVSQRCDCLRNGLCR